MARRSDTRQLRESLQNGPVFRWGGFCRLGPLLGPLTGRPLNQIAGQTKMKCLWISISFKNGKCQVSLEACLEKESSPTFQRTGSWGRTSETPHVSSMLTAEEDGTPRGNAEQKKPPKHPPWAVTSDVLISWLIIKSRGLHPRQWRARWKNQDSREAWFI